MRKRFEMQTELGQTTIENVRIPTKSRDELPPVLAGLQWIFCTPEVNTAVFDLLAQNVNATTDPNNGRPGMDLWTILVLGTIRLALDCDYDRLAHIATYDGLVRQMLGLPVFGIDTKDAPFHHRTISDNICQFDETLLAQINAIIITHGQPILKKNASEKLHVKTDSYVLETNVHYPTDANLLADAARKAIQLTSRLSNALDLDGWRKASDWQSRLKSAQRTFEKTASKGGPNKHQRVQSTAQSYLGIAHQVETKVNDSINTLRIQPLTPVQILQIEQIIYFQDHLIKHIDLLERRVIQGETIPHEEKIFSLFEPHTELIKKGKVMPPIEFGHRLLISTEAHGFILDYKIMVGGSEHAEAIPAADRLLQRFGAGSIASHSFDKGFSSNEDRELISLYIPLVIMPKSGAKRRPTNQRRGQARPNLKKSHRKGRQNTLVFIF
jgi:transposase, IS5 family